MRHSEERFTAVHEAAHAVVRIARGRMFKFVEICPGGWGDGWIKIGTNWMYGEEIRSEILGSLASIPAERLLDSRRTRQELMTTTCANDYDDALKMCSAMDTT